MIDVHCQNTKVTGQPGKLLFWVVGPAAKVIYGLFSKNLLISQVVDSLSDSEVAEGATRLLQLIHKNIVLPKPRFNSLLFVLVSERYENMYF